MVQSRDQTWFCHNFSQHFEWNVFFTYLKYQLYDTLKSYGVEGHCSFHWSIYSYGVGVFIIFLFYLPVYSDVYLCQQHTFLCCSNSITLKYVLISGRISFPSLFVFSKVFSNSMFHVNINNHLVNFNERSQWDGYWDCTEIISTSHNGYRRSTEISQCSMYLPLFWLSSCRSSRSC